MTGKGSKASHALRDQELGNTIAAGRAFDSWEKGLRPYRDFSTPQLLQALKSWSPAVRSRAAKVLAARKDVLKGVPERAKVPFYAPSVSKKRSGKKRTASIEI